MAIILEEMEEPIGQPTPHFRLIKSETISLTKGEALKWAQEHAGLPHSACERDLDAKHVKELVERIKAGLWLPCCWSTVDYERKKYRMNGQHSSNAMLEARESLGDNVVIHLDHYQADDAFGMGLLFRQFDARISSRSKLDISGAYQGLVPQLRDLNKKDCKLGMDGALWYRRNVEGLPVPSGDRASEQLLDRSFHPFLQWLDSILSLKTPELKQVGVVAAMYGTFTKSESGAEEFWRHVAKTDVVDDLEPSAVLSAELMKSIEEKDQRLQVGVAYAKAVTAWNAYRTGKKVRSLPVNPKRKGLPDIAG
jgi:hypothetical protein